MLDVNPVKQGVENPQRRRTEKRPFESWAELEAVAARLGRTLGPMVIFAAATGMRSGEWVLDQLPPGAPDDLLFPALRGRPPRPAQLPQRR